MFKKIEIINSNMEKIITIHSNDIELAEQICSTINITNNEEYSWVGCF